MSRILLVEDALDLAQSIKRELEAEGYQVWHACDGLQALESFERYKPHIIILDWMLPKMDGLQVLKTIRTSSFVPVLMLTARGDEVDRVVGLEVGADDYLTKPFSMHELIARVRALLRRVANMQQMIIDDRQPAQKPIDYEDLHIDPRRYQAHLQGDELELTRTEFDLLYLLVRHPGRAYSRVYLLDTVWGENYVPGDRSVDNAILRLRKKLGSLGEQIETVWGVGYRLRAAR
ncbi:response regulator transcription factor [Chloroflexota bacterium]